MEHELIETIDALVRYIKGTRGKTGDDLYRLCLGLIANSNRGANEASELSRKIRYLASQPKLSYLPLAVVINDAKHYDHIEFQKQLSFVKYQKALVSLLQSYRSRISVASATLPNYAAKHMAS